MLIPQFSLRWLLAVTTVCAVIFSVMGLAVRGSHWAAAVSIAVGSLVVAAMVYALLFAMVWLFSVITSLPGRKSADSGQSPFVERSAP